MSQGLRRRLFLVPLANNDHGKTTLVLTFLNIAEQRDRKKLKKGQHALKTPSGDIDAYVFPRSFQEVEKNEFAEVELALRANDHNWMQRDLIIMPSHIDVSHCEAMIAAGHKSGFDVVAVPVFLSQSDICKASECLSLPWDERWTLHNCVAQNWQQQVRLLAAELWEATCAKIFFRAL